MKKISLLAVFIFWGFIGFGQGYGINATLPQVTKPETSINALMQFQQIAVNTNTGIPNISVPIYNLLTRSKDISLNLSLQYHPYSCLLYNAPIGDCGLGWSLFDGGAVARTVLDLPDELSIVQGQNIINDIYEFVFLGNTGRFYLEKDAQGMLTVKLLSNEGSIVNIVVNHHPTTYEINSFTIYDNKGYRFEFNDFDFQTYYNVDTYAPQSSYRSAFHLSKVVDNNNKDLLNFSYRVFNKVINANYTDIIKKTNEIVSEGYGKIQYTYLTPAGSTVYDDTIKITEFNILDSNNAPIQKTKLIGALYQVEHTTSTNANQRYTFKYDTTLTFNNGFTGSYTEDMWGFRIWEPTCYYLFDSEYIDPIEYVNIQDYAYQNYSLGVLNQIDLPTGGSIHFDFERNTFSCYSVDSNGNWVVNNSNCQSLVGNEYDNVLINNIAHHEFTGDGQNSFTFTIPGTPNSHVEVYISAEGYSYTRQGFTDANGNPAIFYPNFTITQPSGQNIPTIGNTSTLNKCLGQKITLKAGIVYTVTINGFLPETNKRGLFIVSKKDSLPPPNNQLFYGPGLRVKAISYFDKVLSTNYYDNKTNFNNGGTFPIRELKYSYNFFSNPLQSSGFCVANSSNPIVNDNVKRTPVYYKNVTITETGRGKELLTYTTPADYPYIGQGDLLDFMFYDYKCGLLTNKKIYDDSSLLQLDVDYSYGFSQSASPTVNLQHPALNEFVGWSRLTQKVSKSYFSNSVLPYTTTENYNYNTTLRLLTSKSTINSLGETYRTDYTYHVGNSVFSRNRVAEINEIDVYRGTELLFTERINYSNTWNGNVSFLPSTIQRSKGTQTLETVTRINSYDEFSNPIEVQTENGIFVTYLWGYNKTRLIAKIENASNSQVATAMGVSNVTLLTEANMTAINNLRNATSMATAMITTYTHIPLIGISTVTDPKGDRRTYEYDIFNRPRFERDKDNMILNENLYYFPIDTLNEINSITNISYNVPTTTPVVNPNLATAFQSKTFIDRLGRPIQQIAHQLSNSGKDIVTHIEYGAFGQQTKQYLPYANGASSLNYNPNAKIELLNYPDYVGQYPYSEIKYESSSLNRVVEQAAPGADWQIDNPDKHTIRYEYYTNSVADNVKKLVANASESTFATLGYYSTSLTDTGIYAANELTKTILKNENWKPTDGLNNTVEEFKNKEGRQVLKRTYALSVVNGIEVNTTHDTYTVYDQYGNLSYVLPPKADGAILTTVVDELCYQYRYDHKNRLVEKKVPGKQWEFLVYDKLDRVVAVGPTLSPFTNAAANTFGWLIAKYDAFNRKILSAWQTGTTTSSGRRTLQNSYNATTLPMSERKSTANTTVLGVAFRYTNTALPTSGYNVLTVDYFDDYGFTGGPTTFTTVLNDNSQAVFYNNTTFRPRGLVTGSWKRCVEATTTTPVKADLTHVLYDGKARAVRARTVNYLGGYTQLDSRIDFAGKVLFTETKHKRLNADPTEIYIREAFTYSAQNRLLTHTHQIGTAGTPQVLSQNTYNELGRIISRRIGNTLSDPLQKVDYAYNIRGWLTQINDINSLIDTPRNDLFSFKINYNQVENETNYTGKSQYNGNIAETYWRTSNDNVLRKYGYDYDHLNRLKSATYQKPGAVAVVTGSYNESAAYDKNGNIMSMQRNGDYDDPSPSLALEIDNLTYSYDLSNGTNRLMKVTDATNFSIGFDDDSDGTNDTVNDYSYDANGNLTSDQNKAITSIKYNHLNLPLEIVFSGSTIRRINYLYTGSGEKLQMIETNGTVVSTTDYLGGFQYKRATATSNPVLLFFPHAEGYVNNTVSGGINNYNYIYTFKDHLGNVRLVYTRDNNTGNPRVLKESNYYPFGLEHSNYNWDKEYYEAVQSGEIIINKGAAFLYNYRFNGQEFQESFLLNNTAMDFRQYDNATGRFNCIDLLAETSMEMTPYHFGRCNPNYWADPSGLDVEVDEDGITFTGVDARTFFYAYNAVMYGGLQQASYTIIGTFNPGGGELIPVVHLPELVIGYNPSSGHYDGNLAGIFEGHVYWNSKYYQGWRDNQRTKQWDDFQSALDWMGTAPLIGEPIDLINAGISAIRGNGGAAALSLAAMVPVAGWAATGAKIGGKFDNVIINEIRYQDRVINATDTFHNFPYSFDKHIIENGAWSQRINDRANWYELSGSINQRDGIYQIGINSNNEIFHKAFIPN
jgi:RHS repeat-associated protein